MKQAPFMQSLTQQYTNCQRRYKALRRKYLFKTSQKKGHRGQNMPSAVAKLVSHLVGIRSFTTMAIAHLVRDAPNQIADNSHITKYTLGVKKIQKRFPVIFAVFPNVYFVIWLLSAI